MKELITEISKNNPGLKNGEIEGLLYILKMQPGIKNNELIIETGLPKETLRIFKQSISTYLVDSEDDSLNLKPDFSTKIESINFRPYLWSFNTLQNNYLEQEIKNIRKKYELGARREFDQFYATPKTTASKVMALEERDQIKGKRIAFLGDDDLVSVALGMYSSEYSEIVAFDIDTNLLSLIKTIIKDLNIKNIRTEHFDVRKDMKPEFMSSFDVVVTDPPYTKNGVELFLNNAIKMSKKNAYIFFYYGNSFKSPEKTVKVQEIISGFNLEIEDKINKFARYQGAESIGNASSLYILKTTPFTKSKVPSILSSSIYTYEDRKEENFPFVDHFTFKIYNVPEFIVNQKKAVTKVVEDFCVIHRLKVVDTKVTQFKGKGLTLTLILTNSNLLVHTWPEHRAVHIDLITCSPIYNKEFLGETVSKLFRTGSVEVRKVE